MISTAYPSSTTQHAALLTLTPAQLALVAGDRRQRLLTYLLRWEHIDVALRYVDVWLQQQPGLATLREARVRALLAAEQPEQALELLDGLDVERGTTETRRGLRVRALTLAERFEDALALLPFTIHDTATGWRQRAEVLRQAGRFSEAAAALDRAAALMPEGVVPTRGLAELALAQGDAAQAQHLLQDKLRRSQDQPEVEDVRLLLEAAAQLGDDKSIAELIERMMRYEQVEREELDALLGLEERAAKQAERDSKAQQGSHAVLGIAEDDLVAPSPIPEAALAPEVFEALREHFGYTQFRPGQAAVVARALEGKSTLAVMPTGSGKSLTYQLPSLLLPGATVVISPLIALMKDQIDNLPPAIRSQATAINSSLPPGEINARLRGVAEGRYRLVYVAPERLRQQPFVQTLKQIGISLFVVDEAHCVSLWGISFRPDYLFISRVLDELGHPPVLALTATATPETQAEIKAQLGNDLQVVSTSVFRPNLRFEVYTAANQDDKLRAVVELCGQIEGPIIVYARSRASCEEIATALRRKGIAADHYHAQVEDRSATQERFMTGATRVLAATVAFGMGVDKRDVRAIIHYNLPQSVEAYYQEAGRAGRDGLPARCILLYTSSDKSQLTSWLRQDALTKDMLRNIYRSLKRRTEDGWGVITLGDVQRELREEDETRLRVALGLLERAGLLVRHFDMPRTATLALRNTLTADEALRDFAERVGLQPGHAVDVEPLELALRTGLPPAELEAQLIEWDQQGWLRYDGSSRDVLLELCPAPPDSGARLDTLLDNYGRQQNIRIDAIAAYARNLGCRHRALARHFGERLAACGEACDICIEQRTGNNIATPQRELLPQRPSATSPIGTNAIIAAVNELPGRLSDKELTCLLLGQPGYPACNSYGALAGADFAAIRQQIGRLVATGRLAYKSRALVPVAPGQSTTREEPAGLLVLRCLAHMPFPVGRSGLARVLKAAAGSTVQGDRCPEYGALHDLSMERIETLIEDLINGQLIARDEQNSYRLLSLTDYGQQTLGQPDLLPAWAELRPTSASSSRKTERSKAGTQAPVEQPENEQVDEELLERLTQWRKAKAQEQGLPSYYIFANATLQSIAAAHPTTLDALGRVKGVGPQKLAQYGAEVLALIGEG